MNIQIRQGVFETNSSSTHSITMCDSSLYKKWVLGELYIHMNKTGSEQFLPTELAKKWNKELILNDPEVSQYFDKFERDDEDDDDDGWDGDCELDELGYVIDCEYAENCYISYDQWCSMHSYYETYEEGYETISGDRITAFGYYGHD